jgi:hypothetical protein
MCEYYLCKILAHHAMDMVYHVCNSILQHDDQYMIIVEVAHTSMNMKGRRIVIVCFPCVHYAQKQHSTRV